MGEAASGFKQNEGLSPCRTAEPPEETRPNRNVSLYQHSSCKRVRTGEFSDLSAVEGVCVQGEVSRYKEGLWGLFSFSVSGAQTG